MGPDQAAGGLGGGGAVVFHIPGWSRLFRRKMIWGWGPAGGQGALFTASGNSIPLCPLAEVSLLSREPLLSGAKHPYSPSLGLNLTFF